MKEISKKSSIFELLISKQKYMPDLEYRFFSYILKYECDGGIILFNTLTLQMYYLEQEEYSSIDFKNSNLLFQKLVADLFIVPVDFNDEKLKIQTITLIKKFNQNKGNYTHYTIMPTMECNARCFYCFEHGTSKCSMSEKTAYDVAEYIVNKSKGQKVSIQWFGGEPLYNEKVIDLISKKLNENNISFKSRMISNGYLFNDNNIKKAKELWNLKYVQVTLDGTEEIYNRIKAYIYKTGESPFKIVLNNIERLLENNIRVLIRLNMDEHNLSDLYSLIDLLSLRFEKYKSNLSIYTWLLYDSRKKQKRDIEKKTQMYDELLKIEKYIDKKELSLKTTLKEEYKIYSCIADSDIAVTILPNGEVGKCDHYSNQKFIGSIYSSDEDIDMINIWKDYYPQDGICKKCPISPQCLKLKNCPEQSRCDRFEQQHMIWQYYNKMKNSYCKFKNNQ